MKLRQELVGEAGLAEEPEPRRWVVDSEQLGQLVPDPFGADNLEAGPKGPDRGDQLRHGLELEPGHEARCSQHPERVGLEGRLG